MNEIPFTPMKSVLVSKETYELFDDDQWNALLRQKGFDLTKQITYHMGIFGVLVKQWDIPQPARFPPVWK